MLELIPLLVRLIGKDVGAQVEGARDQVMIGALVGVLLATAYGFALAALTVYLAAEFGPVPALCAVAAGAILAAVVVILIGNVRARRRRELHLRRTTTLASVGATLVPTLIRSHPVGIALGLGALAFLLKRGPDDSGD